MTRLVVLLLCLGLLLSAQTPTPKGTTANGGSGSAGATGATGATGAAGAAGSANLSGMTATQIVVASSATAGSSSSDLSTAGGGMTLQHSNTGGLGGYMVVKNSGATNTGDWAGYEFVSDVDGNGTNFIGSYFNNCGGFGAVGWGIISRSGGGGEGCGGEDAVFAWRDVSLSTFLGPYAMLGDYIVYGGIHVRNNQVSQGSTQFVVALGNNQIENTVWYTSNTGSGGVPTVTYASMGPSFLWNKYNQETLVGFGHSYLRGTDAQAAQTASITTTNLVATPLAGLYRVSAYANTKVAAASGSGCTVALAIQWTDTGAAKTQTLITGVDLTTTGNTGQGDATKVIRSTATAITYTTTLTGGSCASESYDAYLTAERIQ